MPLKLLRKFQKEYGKVKGKNIFYAWENKLGIRYKRRKKKR
jgi:hypothetical protein